MRKNPRVIEAYSVSGASARRAEAHDRNGNAVSAPENAKLPSFARQRARAAWVDVFYGRVQALHGVSLTVAQGEIVALIGSNGAGKTTTLRTVSGLVRPSKGAVFLRGEPIQALGPLNRSRVSASPTPPRARRLFTRMTVRENLEMGANARNDHAGIRTISSTCTRSSHGSGSAPASLPAA